MIQASTDIATGSQTQSYIRSEFPIATPVLMCTLHILFYGRPEIIGKLRSLNHHMNFRIKATHSIGGAYNIIFRNRCTEYTGFAEFLLHTFGYIKHASFFPVCHILSPNKGIGIIAEFSFQCFINGIDQKSLLPFRLMCTIFIFLWLIRFGHYKIINAFRIGSGSSQSLPVGSRQFFLCISFYLLQFFLGQTFITQQHPAELHQGISIFHIFQFILIPIQGVLI